MRWVTDKKHALDSVEVRAGEFGHGVDGGLGALGVAFEDDAFIGVGLEGAGDLVDDVCCSGGRVLVAAGWVDGVVEFASGDGGEDLRVHGAEAEGFALGFGGAACVDDGVRGAFSLSLCAFERCSGGQGREGED